MFAAISPIIPVIIANNAAQNVHSEAGAWGTIAGLAILATIVLVAVIRFSILDMIANRKRRARDAVYAAMKLENDPRLAHDYIAFRAELERRLAK